MTILQVQILSCSPVGTLTTARGDAVTRLSEAIRYVGATNPV